MKTVRFDGILFETMEVHIGKMDTDNFEKLDLHLQTCKTLRCRRCFTKENSIVNQLYVKSKWRPD